MSDTLTAEQLATRRLLTSEEAVGYACPDCGGIGGIAAQDACCDETEGCERCRGTGRIAELPEEYLVSIITERDEAIAEIAAAQESDGG